MILGYWITTCERKKLTPSLYITKKLTPYGLYSWHKSLKSKTFRKKHEHKLS